MPTADFIEAQKSNSDSLTPAKSPAKMGRGRHPNSLANLKLKPFPKGVSGNPGGKPRVDVAAIVARAIIENNVEGIYEALGKALLKGNGFVFRELAERGYGKINTPVTVEAGETLANLLAEGRQRAAQRQPIAVPALPQAVEQAVEIIPAPPAPPATSAVAPKPVVVAKPAPPAAAASPAAEAVSAEERSRQFFDYTTGKCVSG